jgi:hypothetical protein
MLVHLPIYFFGDASLLLMISKHNISRIREPVFAALRLRLGLQTLSASLSFPRVTSCHRQLHTRRPTWRKRKSDKVAKLQSCIVQKNPE